jgi:hypothetical protein
MTRPTLTHPIIIPDRPPKYYRTPAELIALWEWHTLHPSKAHRMARMEGLSYLEFQGLLGRAIDIITQTTTPRE